jgi:high affinity choline transporter 7
MRGDTINGASINAFAGQVRGWIRNLVLFFAAALVLTLFLAYTQRDIHWGAYFAMLFFYAVIFGVGSYAGVRSGGSLSDMMLAGRALPLGVAVFTMTATWVGGGYINGTAEYTYAWGLVWAQAPWGYALSLIIGGLFYARIMRRHNFTTMLDPLEARFGKKMASVLYIPALSGEIFWTGAILTALGTTFGTILGLDFSTAIIISAAIAIAYTAVGGLWAVAFTDVFQLVFLICGLWIVIPFALEHVGGFSGMLAAYNQGMAGYNLPFPPLMGWKDPNWGNWYWNWWDYALLLIFGGLPWHVYFQRVLSAKDENTAMRLSILAGFLCMFAAVPAVLIGMIGFSADWAALGTSSPEPPAMVLPYVLRYMTPPLVATIGLGALAAAVMSSVDSSILSASSMAAWNVYRPLVNPRASTGTLLKVIRRCIVIIGVAATLIALKVQSVYALWFLCSDFVYCILFPQLTTALFFKKANRYGSIAGLIVSFTLRFGGGEPVLHIPRLIPYPMVDPATDTVLFPFRTLAMLAGLLTIIVVSLATQKICPPQPLCNKNPLGQYEKQVVQQVQA